MRSPKCLSACVLLCGAQLCPALCHPTDSHQAPLSVGFPRKEYWCGSPVLTPGKMATHFARQECWSGLPFPDLGIEPVSLASPALAGGFFTTEPPGKPTCLPNLLENRKSLDLQWLWVKWHGLTVERRTACPVEVVVLKFSLRPAHGLWWNKWALRSKWLCNSHFYVLGKDHVNWKVKIHQIHQPDSRWTVL